jgi:hypothetical protein
VVVVVRVGDEIQMHVVSSEGRGEDGGWVSCAFVNPLFVFYTLGFCARHLLL